MSADTRCELCTRKVRKTSRHHLVPRQYGGEETVDLCSLCHRQIHALFTNRTLAGELNTIERLRAAPEIQRYLRWARKQDDRRITVRSARRKR